MTCGQVSVSTPPVSSSITPLPLAKSSISASFSFLMMVGYSFSLVFSPHLASRSPVLLYLPPHWYSCVCRLLLSQPLNVKRTTALSSWPHSLLAIRHPKAFSIPSHIPLLWITPIGWKTSKFLSLALLRLSTRCNISSSLHAISTWKSKRHVNGVSPNRTQSSLPSSPQLPSLSQ